MILNNFVDNSLEEVMGSMLSALDDNNQTSIALYNRFGHSTALQATATVPFSSKRKLSAVTFGEAGTFAMGAPEFVLRPMPPKIDKIVKQYAAAGLRVLLLAYSPSPIAGGRLPSLFRPAAIITLADNIRPDALDTIKWFRENDVDIKIISGDNPVTVSEVARRVGVQQRRQVHLPRRAHRPGSGKRRQTSTRCSAASPPNRRRSWCAPSKNRATPSP